MYVTLTVTFEKKEFGGYSVHNSQTSLVFLSSPSFSPLQFRPSFKRNTIVDLNRMVLLSFLNNSYLPVTFRDILFTALFVGAQIPAQLYRKYTLTFHDKVQVVLSMSLPWFWLTPAGCGGWQIVRQQINLFSPLSNEEWKGSGMGRGCFLRWPDGLPKMFVNQAH